MLAVAGIVVMWELVTVTVIMTAGCDSMLMTAQHDDHDWHTNDVMSELLQSS